MAKIRIRRPAGVGELKRQLHLATQQREIVQKHCDLLSAGLTQASEINVDREKRLAFADARIRLLCHKLEDFERILTEERAACRGHMDRNEDLLAEVSRLNSVERMLRLELATCQALARIEHRRAEFFESHGSLVQILGRAADPGEKE